MDGCGAVEPLISAVTLIVTPELSAFPGFDKSLNRHSMALPFPACLAEAPTRGFSAFVKLFITHMKKAQSFSSLHKFQVSLLLQRKQTTKKKKKVMFHISKCISVDTNQLCHSFRPLQGLVCKY